MARRTRVPLEAAPGEGTGDAVNGAGAAAGLVVEGVPSEREHARGSGRDGEGGAGHEVMDSAVARGGPSRYTNEGLPYGGLFARALPILHRMFLSLNRWVAVPIIRAGLAPAWGTPFGGYFVMIRTRGRKTGAIRDAPLGYGISDGCAYVMAGFGRRTQWLRNIEADPHVDVWLPGRTFSAIAEQVTDPAERARGLRSATIGCGLVGRAAFGLDPRTAPDESILRAAEGIPLVRLRPTGIAAGPDDPGGQGWILRQVAVAWISWRALRWLGRHGRRRGSLTTRALPARGEPRPCGVRGGSMT